MRKCSQGEKERKKKKQTKKKFTQNKSRKQNDVIQHRKINKPKRERKKKTTLTKKKSSQMIFTNEMVMYVGDQRLLLPMVYDILDLLSHESMPNMFHNNIVNM
jgi:acyl CoA:acetate/3-ketoacid CoA transferase beta subunit